MLLHIHIVCAYQIGDDRISGRILLDIDKQVLEVVEYDDRVAHEVPGCHQ